MNQTWKIHVDGAEREVVAEIDAASARAAIRVDGRIAARPLAPGENERELTIDGHPYVVRRQPAGGFTLERAKGVPRTPSRPAHPAARRTSPGRGMQLPNLGKLPVGKIVSGVVVTLLIGLAVRYGSDAWAYFNVPWQSYMSPDRQFLIKMAGDPERTEGSVGGGYSSAKLFSRFRRHAYVVEWIEFPAPIPDERTFPILHDVMGAIIRHHKARLEFGERSYTSGVNTVVFRATFPEGGEWSRGSLRGKLFFHKKRLYAVYGYAPEKEILTYDIGWYLSSLQLSD